MSAAPHPEDNAAAPVDLLRMTEPSLSGNRDHRRRALAAGPLLPTTDDHFVTGHHDTVFEVLTDRRFGRDPEGAGVSDDVRLRRRSECHQRETISFLGLDPPVNHLRREVATLLSAASVSRRRPSIEDLARRHLDLDDARKRGTEVDLIPGIIVPYVTAVLGDVLGLAPATTDSITALSVARIGRTQDRTRADEEADRCPADGLAHELHTLRRPGGFDKLAAMLSEDGAAHGGGPRGSVASALHDLSSSAEVPAKYLADTLALLVVAGLDTQVDLLGSIAHRVITEPPPAGGRGTHETYVEEVLREHSPVQVTSRTALTDCEVGGISVRAGQEVFLDLGTANRDERSSRNGHLAFAAGPHFCLGAPLARAVAVAFLMVITQWEIYMTRAPHPRSSRLLYGLSSLPVIVRARRG